MDRPKSWDEYELKARYAPCLVAMIPLAHLLVIVLGNVFWLGLIETVSWMLVTDLGIATVAVLSLMQVQVTLGKVWIEKGVFGAGGISFPTTEMLLLKNNQMSTGRKNAIRERIATEFGISLLGLVDETKDTDDARLAAREAVSMVRNKVGKGTMTHQYNIRYGFFRNLIAGVIWVFPGCVGSAIYYGINREWVATVFFSLIMVVFLLLLCFKKAFLGGLAIDYADALYTDYMAKTNGILDQ